MVKPFRMTYLAKRGGGGGGSGCHTPLKILTIACLTFCLLLIYRSILGLPEDRFKMINICETHETGDREVVVFHRCQRYVEIVRKLKRKCYNSFIFQFNDLKAQLRCKVIETTLQYQILSAICNLLLSMAKNCSIVLTQI